MYKYGKRSLKVRDELHPKLQLVVDQVIKIIDCSLICGHRDEETQNKAFEDGYSSVKFPNSKHNKLPSHAVDIVPFPSQYSDEKYVMLLAGIVLGVAHGLGIELRWGGDWDGDGDMYDQNLKDPYHFELVNP